MLPAAALAIAAFLAPGTEYFVSPLGNDGNDGTAPARAWRTLARASKAPLKPGDEISLAAGAAFVGSLALGSDVAGTREKPIVVRSSGKPAARIVSPDRPAISASRGGLEIRDLVLEGRAKAAKKRHDGILLATSGDHNERRPYVRIEDVDVSGFGGEGIDITSTSKTHAGFDDVLIRHVVAHDNFGSGIATSDAATYPKAGYSHTNLVVTDCVAARNHSGTGIVIGGVDGGRVEYCRASDNSGKGGGVGIWAWSARHVFFRFCISEGTRTGGGDGGGFDLDGGCVECAMERCLAYENAGPGYMHCDYPYATSTHDNIFRHCVSVNDGRKPSGSEIGFGFVSWGSGVDNCHVESNLTVVLTEPRHLTPFGALFVVYILGSQGKDEKPHVMHSSFVGNISLVEAPGVDQYHVNMPKTAITDTILYGNRILRPGKGGLFGSTLEDARLMGLGKTDYHITDPRELLDSPFIQFAAGL
jgi:hypothetical protein